MSDIGGRIPQHSVIAPLTIRARRGPKCRAGAKTMSLCSVFLKLARSQTRPLEVYRLSIAIRVSNHDDVQAPAASVQPKTSSFRLGHNVFALL